MKNLIKQRDNFKKNLLKSIGFFSVLLMVIFLYQRYFVVNLTDSMPTGLYLKTYPILFKKNDLVLLCLEGEVSTWATTHHIIPQGMGCKGTSIPLLKKIIALKGDYVLLTYSGFIVNGVPIKNTIPIIGIVKQWFPLNQNIVLKDNEFIVIADYDSRSFDSRYFGIIQRDQITAKVIPIWI